MDDIALYKFPILFRSILS